jgi:amino acid transporter
MTESDQPGQPSVPPQQPAGSPPPYPPQQYGGYPGGYPPPPPQPYAGSMPPPAAPPKNGMGIASLVVAIVGLLTVFGGILLGVVAIILGFIGVGRVKRGEATNRGVAIAGIVLGVLGIAVSIAAIALAVWGFKEVGGNDLVDCIQRAGNDEAAQQQCQDDFQTSLEDKFSVTITTSP